MTGIWPALFSALFRNNFQQHAYEIPQVANRELGILGLICLLLIALWVRSYFWADAVPRMHIASAQGALYMRQSFQLQPGAKNETFRLETITMPLDGQMIVRVGPRGLVVPFWMITLLTLGLVTVPWLRWRFSLRTLLMFTTLLAAILGLIVFATQRH